MSNQDDRQLHNHEVRQEFYRDANGNTHNNVTRTTETVNNTPTASHADSYRNGYVNGSVAEHQYQEEVLVERDNNNAARGLLLGILVTSLAALTAGAIWLLNQSNEAPTQVVPPVIVPAQPKASPSPEAKQPPAKETIIERTRDVLVPVPQPQAPSPAPQPEVNISVPNTPNQPAARQEPATNAEPAQPQTQSSSTDTQATQSDTNTPTSTQESSEQTDTTSGSDSTPSDSSNTSSSAQE